MLCADFRAAFVVGVVLPDMGGISTLRIRTLVEGSWKRGDATVLYPQLHFFSADFEPIVRSGTLPYEPIWRMFARARGIDFSAVLPDPVRQRARYLVIGANPQFSGKAFYFSRDYVSAPFGLEASLELTLIPQAQP